MSYIEKQEVCPKCGGKLMSIEYGLMDKYHHDGVSEIACTNGDYRRGAFCGQELTEKAMVEPLYCEGRGHPRVFSVE